MKRSVIRRFPLSIAVAAVIAAVIAPVGAVHAAEIQYALNREVSANVRLSSANANIYGGRANINATVPYLETISQTVDARGNVVYTSVGGGNSTSFNHGLVSGGRSTCYWRYLQSNPPGTLPMNCWRRN